MAFDPLSVIGFVGTVAGLTSFIVTTVENIKLRVQTYKECSGKLKDYNHQLETCVLEIEEWSRTWTRRQNGQQLPYSETIYELFWGEAGFSGIVNRFERIREQVQNIREILECRHLHTGAIEWTSLGAGFSAPSPSERSKWAQSLSNNSLQPSKLSIKSESRLYSFLFAIYKNSEIKGKLVELAEMITELRRYSDLNFKRQHDSRTKKPKATDLQRLEALRLESNALVDFLNDLFDIHRNASMQWDLVLGTPALSDAIQRLSGKAKTQLRFDFLSCVAQDTNLFASGSRPVAIIYPKDSKVSTQTLLDRVKGWNESQNTLTQLQYQPLKLRKLDSLDLEELTEYAMAALYAVRSSILLYKSRWVQGLCSCGIKLCRTPGSKKTVTYFAGNVCDHVDGKVQGEIFLLLAILLAELAVGAAITVYYQTLMLDPLFMVPDELLLAEHKNPLSWDTLYETLTERMYELPGPSITAGYLEAMNSCYELSQTLKRREYLPDDLDVCIQEIVTPLEEEYKLRSERLAELSSRSWFAGARRPQGQFSAGVIAELQ